MKRQSQLAGLGAILFGVLAFVALLVASPPGGTYSESDVANYLDKDHRVAVFLSLYLMLIATAGLLVFLRWLRGTIVGVEREPLFWGFSVAATAAWLSGFALAISPAVARAFGGEGVDMPASVTYTLSEGGWAIMYGAGGLLLGCALLTYVIGAVRVTAWVRWVTAVAALAALAALAWFPFFLVYIWAIVVGLYTLIAERREAAAQAPAAGVA